MNSVFGDHPFLGAWLGDEEIARELSAEAEIAAMARFEGALAGAEAQCGLIATAAAEAIARTCRTFRPDMAGLRAGTLRDGVVAPGFVAQLRAAVGPPYAEFVHLGATSQDVLDTGFALRLVPILDLVERRLPAIDAQLAALTSEHGRNPLMAYTRMRAALPITVADRIANWAAPLAALRGELPTLRPRILVVQLAGPVGTLGGLGDQGAAVRAELALRLGLGDPGGPWHVRRGRWLELGGWLAGVAAALGKIGLDVGLMAQDGIGTVSLTGGSSSAMPHKVNPVDAELLLALARHAATLQGGLHQSAIHEYERSGSAWTLEWLTLPPLLLATGAATRAAARLLGSIRSMGDGAASSA